MIRRKIVGMGKDNTVAISVVLATPLKEFLQVRTISSSSLSLFALY